MLIGAQMALSRLGDLFPAGCVAIGLSLWLAMRIKPLAGLVFISLFATAVVSCFALKLIARIYAPPLEEAGRLSMSQGAPSGHVVCASVVYGGLLLICARLLKGPVARVGMTGGLLALIGVAVTRFTLYTHTLGDVAAGLVVGLGFLAVLDLALRRFDRPQGGAVFLLAGTALIAGLAVASGLSLSSSNLF